MPDDKSVQSGDQGASPYQEYLDRIPESLRADVEPVFKEWDANVTQRFQKNAEDLKQWEAYQQFQGVDPEALKWGREMYDAVTTDPASVKQWYEQYAEQNGLVETPAEVEETIDFDAFNPDPAQFEALVYKRLGPLAQQMQQLTEAWQQQQAEAAEGVAREFMQRQLDEIKASDPNLYNEQAIEGFAARYIESDPENAIPRAFEDWKAVHSQIQTDALQNKVNNAIPAETGGAVDGAPEPVKWADTKALALERMRQIRSL